MICVKQVFLDVETTGLDPRQHVIHQLSGQIYVDGKLEESFDYNIKPHERGRIDQKALEIAGVTKQQIMQYPDRKVVFKKFMDLLEKHIKRYDKADKYFFCAYNAHFDNGFIRKFFTQNQEEYFGAFFWSNNIDVMVLAAEYLKDSRHGMKDFKLMTVAEFLGIEIDETKAHDSLYDIEITKAVYDIVTKK